MIFFVLKRENLLQYKIGSNLSFCAIIQKNLITRDKLLLNTAHRIAFILEYICDYAFIYHYSTFSTPAVYARLVSCESTNESDTEPPMTNLTLTQLHYYYTNSTLSWIILNANIVFS